LRQNWSKTDLLHVSEDVHATAEKSLSLLAVQLVDERRRVIIVSVLVPAICIPAIQKR